MQQDKKTTAQDKWVNNFPVLKKLENDKIYLLPYTIPNEPFLQYQIINRILNYNE